jgi:hypothetical protein
MGTQAGMDINQPLSQDLLLCFRSALTFGHAQES